MTTCVTPSKTQHLLQYIKNRKVLEDVLTLKDQPNEWIVTVAFYTALHLVESVIAAKGTSSGSHKNRRQNVASIPELKIVRNDYKWLERASYKSRYHCIPLDNNFVTASIAYLYNIENCLSRHGGKTTPLGQ